MDLREKLKRVRDEGGSAGTKKEKSKVNLNPIKYVKDSIIELRKVKWPSRQEVVRGTIGVLIVSFGFVIILGGADMLFQAGLSRILGESNSTRSAAPTHSSAPVDNAGVPIDPGTGQPIDLKGLNIKTDTGNNAVKPPDSTSSK